MPKVTAPSGVLDRLAGRARARPAAAILALSFLLPACTMPQTATFDPDAWKSQRGAAPQDNRRGAMVEGLKTAVRDGMPREEVVALLGEPDSRNAATGVEVYELGVSAVGVDEEYFEVRYQDGRVASSRWARR